MNEEIKKEILGLQSSLPQQKHPDGMNVPQGYFEQLPDVVWQRIQNEAIAPPQIGALTKTRPIKLWKVMAIAATLMLGILLITRLWNETPNTTPGEHSLVDLSKDELEKYLLDNSDYLEPDDLIPLLNDQSSTIGDELILPFNPSELEQYLETENIELEEIL